MSLYRNKYRVESTRLKNWDYSRTGLYFITICTYHHENFFGWIHENTEVNAVNLNSLGKIANEKWKETKQIRCNVDLDEYVVMPNHFHGIVILDNDEKEKMNLGKDSEFNKFGPQGNNLASIIRGYKASVTSAIHDLGNKDFAWQSRFFDHIISSEKGLNKIREYIFYNPIKWKFDKYHQREYRANK